MNKAIIQAKTEELVKAASFSIRPDLKRLLAKAYRREKKKRAKKALGWILDNAAIAKKESLAICQDTGLPVVFIEAGRNIKLTSGLVEAIKQGVEAGYKKNYLRASIVDPILRGKSSYRGGIYHLDFSPKVRGLKITLFPKGFGSENKTKLKMFNPTVDLKEIEEFIVASVNQAGPEACPPFVVGVGIGGTSDQALLLAKKALTEKIDKPNPDSGLNKLEKQLLKKINSLKIGPMGFGGKITALAVKVKKASTHIAGLPVGVNISCHALRSATVELKG
jgi:fumarate hydratase subunit alpha